MIKSYTVHNNSSVREHTFEHITHAFDEHCLYQLDKINKCYFRITLCRPTIERGRTSDGSRFNRRSKPYSLIIGLTVLTCLERAATHIGITNEHVNM